MKNYCLLITFLLFTLGPANAQNALEIMKKVDAVIKAVNDSTFSIMSLSTCKFAKTNKKIKCVERTKDKKLESEDGAKAEDIKNEVRTVDDSWSAEHVQTELTRLLSTNEVMKVKRGYYKSSPF